VVFVIIGSCPSLPAGDRGAGVVLLTGTAIVPPPGLIFRIVVEVAGLPRLEEGD
jgi:hypothetical protein